PGCPGRSQLEMAGSPRTARVPQGPPSSGSLNMRDASSPSRMQSSRQVEPPRLASSPRRGRSDSGQPRWKRRKGVGMTSTVGTAAEIRPFQIEVQEEQVAELRGRIAAARWPSKELVDDRSQGVQLATLKALASYWSTEYDFRRIEARLNGLPQLSTGSPSTSST